MSSEIVKCISCNIVINELLCFVQNKIDIMDEESLIRLCLSTYNNEEIESAKSLLYESISTSTRKISRRKNKEPKNIEDIISVLKTTDPDKTPIFVARLLEKLPPISFDHVDVSALLKDILILKQEVQTLKQSSVTLDQINSLKADINHMKFASLVDAERPLFVNNRRGGYLAERGRDSGPIGIMNLSNTYSNVESTPKSFDTVTEKVHWRTPAVLQKNQAGRHSAISFARCPSPTDIVTVDTSGTDDVTQQRPTTVECGVGDSRTVDTVTDNVSNRFAIKTQTAGKSDNASASADGLDNCVIKNDVNNDKSLAEITRNGEWKSEIPNVEWITVQRKRYRNRHDDSVVRGKAAFMPEDKFKPASSKIPLFLSNVHQDASENDIVEYVFSKTKEKVVLHKIKMKTKKDYNAYKIMVCNDKIDMFLSDELWPAGITCRRFRPYKNLKADNEEIKKVLFSQV